MGKTTRAKNTENSGKFHINLVLTISRSETTVIDRRSSVDTEKHCRAPNNPLRSPVCADECQGRVRSSITRVPLKTLGVPVAALVKTGFVL